jgi:hypothetical protein
MDNNLNTNKEVDTDLVTIDETAERVDTADNDDGEFYPVPKGSTRTFALLSLIIALAALAVSVVFPYIGLALGIGGIILSVLSQRLVGYFDKLAIAGLIIAIFAFVFAAFTTGIIHSGILDGVIIR